MNWKRMYNDMARAKDGILRSPDLNRGLPGLGIKLTKERVHELIKKYDLEGTGRLHLMNFEAFIKDALAGKPFTPEMTQYQGLQDPEPREVDPNEIRQVYVTDEPQFVMQQKMVEPEEQ